MDRLDLSSMAGVRYVSGNSGMYVLMVHSGLCTRLCAAAGRSELYSISASMGKVC